LWLHSLKVAQLLRSAACLHTNQSRSYLNHLVNICYINFVFRGRTMGQEDAGLSPRWVGFNPSLVYVTSVVYNVALGQVSLRIIRPFPGIFQ